MSAVRVFGGDLPLLAGVEFVAACLLFAVVASVVWLWGQTLAHRAWILAVGLIVLVLGSAAIGQLFAFTPWGWLAAVWGGDSAEIVPALVGLTALAGGSLLVLPATLNSLSRETLLHHAQQWQAVSIAAVTGDLATALGRFRAVPRIGRRWSAVGSRPVWMGGPRFRFLRSDTVGAVRTPVRLLCGLATLMAAFALLSLSLLPNVTPAWLLAAVAAGAAYVAGGVLVDGFRFCAISVGAPPLYPYSAGQLYVLHSTFPIVATGSAALIGFWVGTWFGVPIHALLACLLVSLLVVVARAFDSAKGAPPLLLMSSPVPTPAGDPMVLFLFAWQADALLIVSASAGLISSLVTTGQLGVALVTSGAVAAGLIVLLRRRLRVS